MRYAILFSAALVVSSPAQAADLFAAGRSLFRLPDGGGSPVASMKLISPATDVEVDPQGRYVVVSSAWGLHLYEPSTLTAIDSMALGILDCVELSPDGDTIYTLHHPGSNQRQAAGNHQLMAIPFASPLAPKTVASTGPWSYDMYRDPTGHRFLITNNLGREVDVVDLDTGDVHTVKIALGDENEMAVLRSVAWMNDGTALIGESARTLPLILWRFHPVTGELEKIEMPWRMFAVNLVVSGEQLFINGLDQMAWVSLGDLSPVTKRDLTRNAHHAIGDGAGHVLLAAPAEDGARVLRVEGTDVTTVATLPDHVTQLARGTPRVSAD